MAEFSTIITTVIGIGTIWIGGSMVLKSMENKQCPPMTFDTFLEKASTKIDEYIIESTKKDKIAYYGGKCKIFISGTESTKIQVENKVYGRDSDGNWKESLLYYKVPTKKFSNDNETKKQLNSLKSIPLVYEVAVPENGIAFK